MQESIILMDHIHVNCSYKIANFTNDGVHDSILNVSMETFDTIENILVSAIIKVPANEKDKNYLKEFYRIAVHMKKLFNGIEASFVSNIRHSIDFELKFPFQKVESQTYHEHQSNCRVSINR